MPEYLYPTNQKLTMIEQDLLPVLQPNDPIFDHLPIETSDDDILRWEQYDTYKGLQQIRGLNGEPPRVARVGAKGYIVVPAAYGENETVDEREMTRRAKLGTFGDRVDLTDPIRMIQDHLITREFARIRQILWTMVTTGTISVANTEGTVVYTDSFPLQTFTAPTSWATFATATPLADLRLMKLLARGHSVDLGSKAVAFGNQQTINNLLNNQNAADLFGRRGQYGSTFNSLVGDNSILLENGLVQIQVMDDGYWNDAGQFQLFIPNNKLVVFGVRPNNRPIGAYRKTYNANSGAGGSYTKISDNTDREVPRQIVVHRGHNGGVVCYFGSAIVIMNV